MGLGHRPRRGLGPRQRAQRARIATLARVALLGALAVSCVCGFLGVRLLRAAIGQPAPEATQHGVGRTLLSVGDTFRWAPASIFPGKISRLFAAVDALRPNQESSALQVGWFQVATLSQTDVAMAMASPSPPPYFP